ncbi:ATP-binding protein [Candidatus Uhrbacteria bacterium]|nr:ATP-binding protein [Candidatus Uhrbacteria bacterium]
MYTRLLKIQERKSFFLFGPRGTGKTTWLKTQFPGALYFDLLDSEIYTNFLARPNRLASMIPTDQKGIVILDEVQRVPALLHEVHRLIESRGLVFALTGSSTRKLKAKDVNLLAGRALTFTMYPLTAHELGKDFSFIHALNFGTLPSVIQKPDARQYLESYVATYLREEVQQEGLTRNLGAFTRFLEEASFSQGSLLNISEVSRECAVNRKVVEHYFSILEDLLIAERIPVFTKRAQRNVVSHPKFYFFDAGVYRAIRPRGPLDSVEEIDGAVLETLVVQELKALNHYLRWGFRFYFWRTATGQEVDVVLYGERGIQAFEVKRSARLSSDMFRGLRAFRRNYPTARTTLIYGGDREFWDQDIHVIPLEAFLKNCRDVIEMKCQILQ